MRWSCEKKKKNANAVIDGPDMIRAFFNLHMIKKKASKQNIY